MTTESTPPPSSAELALPVAAPAEPAEPAELSPEVAALEWLRAWVNRAPGMRRVELLLSNVPGAPPAFAVVDRTSGQTWADAALSFCARRMGWDPQAPAGPSCPRCGGGIVMTVPGARPSLRTCGSCGHAFDV